MNTKTIVHGDKPEDVRTPAQIKQSREESNQMPWVWGLSCFERHILYTGKGQRWTTVTLQSDMHPRVLEPDTMAMEQAAQKRARRCARNLRLREAQRA